MEIWNSVFIFDQFCRHVNTAKDQLPTIEATIKFGIVPEKGDNILGFEPMVNQRLLPPTFPRYTEIRSKEATYDYLSNLLQRLIEATQVSHLTTYLSALVSKYFCANFGYKKVQSDARKKVHLFLSKFITCLVKLFLSASL